MPDLRDNLSQWGEDYSWSEQGDEWSHSWGGTDLMWAGALAPRLQAFIPSGTILEIAPGYGRWTQFLKDVGEQMIVVDLSQRCIDACRRRFASADNIAYYVNDGRSLAMAEDGSIDLAFSFDSLVHAEADVMGAYLRELASKLKPDGVGFVHHSNMGAYRPRARLAARIPDPLRRRLVVRGVLVNVYGWRAMTMTAELFVRQCEGVGLRCVGQELINWEYGRHLIDCISIFTPAGSRWDRPLVRVANRGFMREATALQRIGRVYGSAGFPPRM